MRELKVVIADDSEMIRDLLHQALSGVEGLSLIGMAADGAEAIRMTSALKPDLVVLDMAMPHKNGIEVLREIRQDGSSSLIIMFTADRSVCLRTACLEAGADYYLDKTQIDELVSICAEQLLDG